MTEPVQRPHKRARDIDLDESDSPQVKCERSLSPLFSERRLVTCGTKRFAPLPSDCLPSCPQYKQNRSQWVARRVKELEMLSLVPERKLIRFVDEFIPLNSSSLRTSRDDGLIIDWRSYAPVWSDTLKPDSMDLAATIVLAHKSNAKWHRISIPTGSPQASAIPQAISAQGIPTSSSPIFGSVYDAEIPLKNALPVPPRPQSKRRNNSSQPVSIISASSGTDASFPCSDRSPLSDETRHETASHTTLRDRTSSLADSLGTPSAISTRPGSPLSPGGVHNPSTAPSESSAAEDEKSEMTLQYLRRYIQTYEEDRSSLASAYARNSSFAYRAHHNVKNASGNAPSTQAATPNCFSSGTKRTRLDIVNTLLTLPCLHSNARDPSGSVQIAYDIFYLGAGLGMFAVCRAVMSTKTIVHNFILQRKEVDKEDAAIDGVWPLTATAHQILVFQ
ncbi:hypothetical protein JVU11DRAFT_4428 [Chiua virens]|nr:hypothetical protein JVU11DRAFT_4428 [Chiua virens]